MKRGLLLLALGGFVMSAHAQTPLPGRPPALGVQTNIVWLYYKDVPAAQRFYEDVIGLTLMVDQGFAKVYQVANAKLLTALKKQ